MKNAMDDKHFIMYVINNLTSEYEYVVAMCEKRLDDPNDPLTLAELRADLSLRYERIHGGKKKDEDRYDDDDPDMALSAFGRFKGKYRKCGKLGHKASQCRTKW